jgi:hypothetical protein
VSRRNQIALTTDEQRAYIATAHAHALQQRRAGCPPPSPCGLPSTTTERSG